MPITGSSGGSVWGSSIYTDDSNIARAAVHAGVVGVGQSATVYIKVLPGRNSYASTNKNGVSTSSYGSWSGSYAFVHVTNPTSIGSAPGSMTGYRGQNNKIFKMTLTGANSGSVWGSGPYTDDSSLARAGIHAGVINAGQTTTVYVQVLPGLSSYMSTNNNGITTSSYGSWPHSYEFVEVLLPSAVVIPTEAPTASPISHPTQLPTFEPTGRPQAGPTMEPIAHPTLAPTDEPSFAPSFAPSEEPTESPTMAPTIPPAFTCKMHFKGDLIPISKLTPTDLEL